MDPILEARLRSGAARRERIDDAIDEWHEMDATLYAAWRRPALTQWLGWSWEEYKRFVERNELPPQRSLGL